MIWIHWEEAGSSGILTLTSDNLASLGASWKQWNAHSHLSDNLASLGSSREQAVSGGCGFAGWSRSGFAGCTLPAEECSLSPLSQSGFTGSKLLAVNLSSLVAVDLATLVASW